MKRTLCDLSHFSFMAGEMGRLQTYTSIPVIAGDAFELSYRAVKRLQPLKRNLTVDAKCDLFAFYVPMRHIYGDDWIEFIKQGLDETVTFPTLNYGAIEIEHLGTPMITGVNPLYLQAAYNRIWNEYFRVPTDTAAILADTDFNTDTNGARYGNLVARPKVIWSTGIEATVDASDREVPAATTLDLQAMAQIQGRLRTEQERDYFNIRYRDIIARQFGGYANPDVDERPTLIKRVSQFMSGHDIDGTGDTSLGTFSGKSATVVGIDVPRIHFKEHGILMIMGVDRFPTIHQDEIHYLFRKSQPTYKEYAADFDILSNEPPIQHQVQDFFSRSVDTTVIGDFPYGQWWRYHPSVVHDQFKTVTAFPFIATAITSKNTARYLQQGEYTNTFQTEQLGHWTTQGRFTIKAFRPIPGPVSSIMAGA